jgi:hypothetical protein
MPAIFPRFLARICLMPFDPKLVRPDDAPLLPSGEIQLPDELAALAEQLSDDAAHLSARYPAADEAHVALSAELTLAAELTQSAARLKSQSRRRVAMLLGVGAASVALCVLPLVRSGSETPPQVPREGIVDSRSTLVPAPRPLPAATNLSLGELSAPEMEALFDLLERDATRPGSVSF